LIAQSERASFLLKVTCLDDSLNEHLIDDLDNMTRASAVTESSSELFGQSSRAVCITLNGTAPMLSNQSMVSKWFASVDLSKIQSRPSSLMSVEPFLGRLYEQSGNRVDEDEENTINSIEDVISVSFSGKRCKWVAG
jgi:hypothetical protein